MTTDLLGFVASGLVLATFSVRSMLWLRAVALASNLAFIAYGWTADLVPIWLLHLCLVPVNVLRGMEELRSRRRQREVPIRIR